MNEFIGLLMVIAGLLLAFFAIDLYRTIKAGDGKKDASPETHHRPQTGLCGRDDHDGCNCGRHV